MAQYDLTRTLTPYMDRHLVLPLLEFLSRENVEPIYSEEDLTKAKIDLLNKTNMVDLEIDLYKKLKGTEETPPEMEERRSAVLQEMNNLLSDVQNIVSCLESIDENDQKQVPITAGFMKEKYGITEKDIDALYTYAKFQFDTGNYTVAAVLLHHYLPLSLGPNGERTEKYMSALWGKLASHILNTNWDDAAVDIEELKANIDNGSSSPLETLQQRTWLMHWSLFVYFIGRRNGCTELFFSTPFMNAIQTVCPHLLRYLTVSVITSTNKRKRVQVKDLVRALQQENNYKDPITELIECLFVQFDFEGAQQKLRECDLVLSNDCFLLPWQADFMENARLLIFETYCRIHKVIDIKMLAEKLNMDQPQAEQWIVDLIRNAKLDAKIDSARGHVIMTAKYPTVYEQVIDNTRSFFYQTIQQASQIASVDI